MYSPLNEDYMFQEMHDRVARISPRVGRGRGQDKLRSGSPSSRRWWHRAPHVAR